MATPRAGDKVQRGAAHIGGGDLPSGDRSRLPKSKMAAQIFWWWGIAAIARAVLRASSLRETASGAERDEGGRAVARIGDAKPPADHAGGAAYGRRRGA